MADENKLMQTNAFQGHPQIYNTVNIRLCFCHFSKKIVVRNSCGVVASVQNCDIRVSEFKL